MAMALTSLTTLTGRGHCDKPGFVGDPNGEKEQLSFGCSSPPLIGDNDAADLLPIMMIDHSLVHQVDEKIL